MGKNLIQQARGKGGPTYRSPSFRFEGKIKLHPMGNPTETLTGTIVELIKCQGHSAPLMRVAFADGVTVLQSAPEGVRKGENVAIGPSAEIKPGNTLAIKDIPEGTLIYNLESTPGDGGKFCRAGGASARIIARGERDVTVILPSKQQKVLLGSCRATVGIIAGAGRLEKPLLKAGTAYWKHRAKNKLYPRVAGNAQNAVDHPFGKSRSHKKGRPTIAPKNAPPGRKVGKLSPRRTGHMR